LQGEERTDWYARLRQYEEDNTVQLDEMSKTMHAIKLKEIEEEKEKARTFKEIESQIKPLFVMGSQIKWETLVDADMDVKEKLDDLYSGTGLNP
jgi:hypothetical protein